MVIYMDMNYKNIELEHKLQNILQRAIDDKYIPGANLLVLKEGQEVAYCEAGYADIEKQTLVNRDTIFRMYSMSKPVTAVAIMILVERGLIDVADPVSSYLPGFNNQHVYADNEKVPVKRTMMIKDLLSMTSGLPYPDSSNPAGREAEQIFKDIDDKLHSDNPLTTLDIANSLGECSLSFHPGDHWMYGTSADILGAVVEVVSGMKYSEFLKKELFEPLCMNDTDFYIPNDKIDRFAKLYENIDDKFVELKTENLGVIYPTVKAPAFESGGAGLTSTVNDYSRFATMLLNNGELDGIRILTPKTVEYLISGELMPWQQEDLSKGWESLYGYTYGNLMRIMKNPGMSHVFGEVGEYGWDGWLGTYFCNFPKSDTTFLLMFQKKDAGTTGLTRKLRNVVISELSINNKTNYNR